MVAFFTTASAQWIQKADMNRMRGEHASVVYDGKIFVFSGIDNPTNGPDVIEVYDPVADTWTDMGTMSRHRNHVTAGASVNGDEVWICGGKTGKPNTTGTKWVDVYNLSTGTWRQGPDLPDVHWGGPAVIVGNELHVLDGAQSNTVTPGHLFVLDLTDEAAGWRTEPDVPQPRVHGAGVALNGKIYLVGGELKHTHNGDTTTVQIYDPATNTWSMGPDLPLPRSHVEWNTFVYEGKIWSVSGVDSSQTPRGQAEIFVLDPRANAWSEFPTALPEKLVSPGARVVGQTLYVFGGGVNTRFDGDMVTTWALPLAADLLSTASPVDVGKN